jgi:hypothetical protein
MTKWDNRRSIRIAALAACLALRSFDGWAGPFEDGMNALKRGDYKAAVGFLQQDAAAASLDAMVALGGIYLDETSTAAQWF